MELQTIFKDIDMPMVERISKLEKNLLSMPQAECAVEHSFMPEVYIRKVTIPAGVFAIGHYQKYAVKNVIVSGKALMLQEDGSFKEMSAPIEFTGSVGKKCGYILEDVVWLNVFDNLDNEQDISILEERFLDKEKSTKINPHKDFQKMLADLKVTKEEVDKQSRNTEDMIPMPFGGSYKFAVADSPIEGKGVFATAPISEYEIIGPSRIGGMRTPLGRYVNHSSNPNAMMIFGDEGTLYLVATKDLSGMNGGVFGDEILVDYYKTRKLVERNELCQQL